MAQIGSCWAGIELAGERQDDARLPARRMAVGCAKSSGLFSHRGRQQGLRLLCCLRE
jgi:hypothetical protein